VNTNLDFPVKEKVARSSNSLKRNLLRQILYNEVNEKVYTFIRQEIGYSGCKVFLFTSAGTAKAVEPGTSQKHVCIDLRLLNHQKDLNAHFRELNGLQSEAGILIGCAETIVERKQRFRSNVPVWWFKQAWFIDFLIHRVIAKIGLTRKIYMFLTKDKYHVISKAEVLGRLVYCGYEILRHETIQNRLYFSAFKKRQPRLGDKPSCGIIFKMKRIGKAGKTIGVYKIRTMHPYSEYLQDYIVRMNGYNKIGKPENDFRLTSWGRFIRKLYLDEMPQLLNVAKGELNLVGVRPLSEYGFKSLPLALQQERIRFKPGCIPPNVSLGITGFNGVIHAEKIYLKAMSRNSLLTNFRFFFMALHNLLSRKSKSS
jgi:lipopolysaccharide/colanic/teichoic acid biosynthesis glycosyltransferase